MQNKNVPTSEVYSMEAVPVCWFSTLALELSMFRIFLRFMLHVPVYTLNKCVV